jgi:serine/threonine protein kinase
MPVPTTCEEYLGLIRKSGVVDLERLEVAIEQLRSSGSCPAEPKELARVLVRQGLLTYFQAEQLLNGKWRGFAIGKYRILERLGSGGMGVVYLGEHSIMRRRVAIKVLPLTLAEDPWFLQQFYRESQLIAALDHPNIVRAHDVDKDGQFHFLVMEYVDGSCLHDIINNHGPMDVLRASHYIRQAACGLQHAHDLGLVHRDIKPGNLLLSRQGVVKILDMGLACFSRTIQKEAGPAKKGDRRMVGTDDFLAPEQIVNSDDVDSRADIYSLGATFYFLLTGKVPFHEAAHEHHKLIWHLTRRPKPIRGYRPEVPEGLEALVNKMLAKNPWDRFATPAAVEEALAPWTQTPIPSPPAKEMPSLSPALQPTNGLPAVAGVPGRNSSAVRSWVVYGVGPGANSSSGILTDASRSQDKVSTATTPRDPPATQAPSPPDAARAGQVQPAG